MVFSRKWCSCADQITIIASDYNKFGNDLLIFGECVFDNSTMILDYIYYVYRLINTEIKFDFRTAISIMKTERNRYSMHFQ